MNLFPDELKEQAKDYPLYSQDELKEVENQRRMGRIQKHILER